MYNDSVLINKDAKLDSKTIINTLEKNGWYLARVRGDHHVFKNPKYRFNVVVTHPVKDVPIGQVRDVMRKTGIKLK